MSHPEPPQHTQKIAAELLKPEKTSAALSLLSTLFHRHPAGVAFLDRDLRYLWVNDRLAAIEGRSVEAHLGRTTQEILGEGAWESRKEFLSRALNGETTENVFLPTASSSLKRPRQIAFSCYPVHDGQDVAGVAAVVTDAVAGSASSLTDAVTGSGDGIDRLQQQRQWLENLLDLLPTAMIMIEPGTGDVLFANRAADLLAGGAFPRGKVGAGDYPVYANQDSVSTRIPHPDRPRMRLARGEEVHGVQLDWRLPHGTRSLIVEGMTLPAMHGNTAVGIMTLQDVTRLRQTERENMALLEEAKETARKQRVFLREVMASVTEGKLMICDDQADLPVPGAPYGDMIILDSTHQLRTSRHLAQDAADALDMPPDRSQNLITAISEAAMNAIVHAGGGTVRVYTNGENMVQVWIEDQGQGIHLDQLPRATLERGYTTAGSLGHGFWLILRTIDRLYLLTGPAGTTVVLEQHRETPTPAWLAEGH